MKKIELFRIVNKSNGKECRSRLNVDGLAHELRVIEGIGLSLDLFEVESEGIFTAKTISYEANSMSQHDIDCGGDNDPFTQTQTIYTAI